MEIKEIGEKIRKVISENVKRRPIKDGKLYPNPVPIEPPLGYVRRPSLHDQIRDMIRSEKLRQEVEEAGFETMEEADDFDIGDDYDPMSPYEHNFDPDPGPPARAPDLQRDSSEGAQSPPASPAEPREEGGGAGGSQTTPPAPAPQVSRK